MTIVYALRDHASSLLCAPLLLLSMYGQPTMQGNQSFMDIHESDARRNDRPSDTYSRGYGAQTPASDTETIGGRTPVGRPYQPQYSRAHPREYQGMYNPYPGPWDESPYSQDSDPFLGSSR